MDLREKILERMKRYNQVMLGGMNGFDESGEKTGAAKIEELEWVLSELKKEEKSSKVDHEWECEQCCCNECCNKEVNGKKCDCPHHKVSESKDSSEKKEPVSASRRPGVGRRSTDSVVHDTSSSSSNLEDRMVSSAPKEKCSNCQINSGQTICHTATCACDCHKEVSREEKEAQDLARSEWEKGKKEKPEKTRNHCMVIDCMDFAINWVRDFNEDGSPARSALCGKHTDGLILGKYDPVFSLEEMAELMEKIEKWFEEEYKKVEGKMNENGVLLWWTSRMSDYYIEYEGVDWPRLFRERPDLVLKIWNEGRSK